MSEAVAAEVTPRRADPGLDQIYDKKVFLWDLKLMHFLGCDEKILTKMVNERYLGFPLPVNEKWKDQECVNWVFKRDEIMAWDKKSNKVMEELLICFFDNR